MLVFYFCENQLLVKTSPVTIFDSADLMAHHPALIGLTPRLQHIDGRNLLEELCLLFQLQLFL